MYAVHATCRSRLATTLAEVTSDRRFLHLARYRFPNGRLWRPAPVAAEPDSLIRSATRVPERRHVASLTGRVLGEEERRLEYGLERASVRGSDNTALFLREGERETDPASRAEPSRAVGTWLNRPTLVSVCAVKQLLLLISLHV